MIAPLFCSALAAQGQPVAPIAPPTRTDLLPPDRRPAQRSVTLTIDGDLERSSCALDQAEYQSITLTLKGARFGGLERVPGISLEGAFASYLWRELPISVLCDIRAQANSILREKGYLATVEIPEQSLADGIVDFRTIFGRLAALKVRGYAGASERIVAQYLEKLTRQAIFNSREAERHLLLADDQRGTQARLSLRQSQIELMDDPDTSHPFYWPAFAVVGDGAIELTR